MARTKGSKNQATLIREMREKGFDFVGYDVDALDYQQTAGLHALVMAGQLPPAPAPVPKAAPPVEKTRIPAEVAKPIYDATEAKLRSMAEWYGFEDEIPERVTNCLVGVFYAETEKDARAVARKALDKFFTTLTALWGRNKVSGPPTTSNIMARIKKAENLCDMLHKKGDLKGLATQERRIITLKAILPKEGEEPKAPHWF